MTFELLSPELICEAAGNLPYCVRSYSGRGMYGETCLGVVLELSDTIAVFFLELVEIILDLTESRNVDGTLRDVKKLAKSSRVDSLGMNNTILYFPFLPYEGIRVI